MAAVEPRVRIREAKVFLASRITEEAEHQGAPLSEIERKMLYFSRGGWTLDDMDEVAAAFEQEYDRREYEKQIARLIRSARARLKSNRDPQEFEIWSTAVRVLKEARAGSDDGDYLLRLIAGAPPEGELTRLIFTALVVIGVMILAIFLVSRGL
jgi:hypothetical protein